MKPLKLEELTLEQKLGLVITARRIDEGEDREFLFDMIRKRAVGGIQVPCGPQTAEYMAEIKAAADYPILIGADMEKGCPLSDLQIPSQMSLAAIDDEELAYQFGAVSAIEAKRCGFNMIWGPIVDILDGPCDCIVNRSLGDDAARTSRIAAAILKGYFDNGVFATAKHWAGMRDITKDPHMFPNDSRLTKEDILNTDIKPYLFAMKEGVLTGIMTGHVQYVNIDPVYPTTLSEKMISILREAGFDGLVLTDSFAMIGIRQRFGEEACYGLAIKAGNDMILPNYRISFRESYNMLKNAYEKGAFSEERLNDAVRHVIAAQNLTLKEPTATEPSDYQRKCFERIGRECITLVKDDDVSVKLDENKKKLFIIVSANSYNDPTGESYEITDLGSINSSNVGIIIDAIKQRYPESDCVIVNQLPSPYQNEVACTAATEADEVVFINFTLSRSYLGSESLTEHISNLMLSMEQKLAAVVQLGNPYTMQDAPHFPRYVFAMGGNTASVANCLDVLTGREEAKGKLPIKLKLN